MISLIKFVVIYLCLGLCNRNIAQSMSLPESATATTLQLAIRDGFNIEEHLVMTKDGYILKMYRLPPVRKRQPPEKPLPPVIIFHGWIGTSSDMMVMGPKKSLAYLLAKEGYDVFLGNMRFNEYAVHSLIPKISPLYWKFSYDEIGLIDIPAQMEAMFLITGAPNAHYVGYSIGATGYVMMCDRRPDLANRVLSFVALGPFIHMTPVYRFTHLVDSVYLELMEASGISVVNAAGPQEKAMTAAMCKSTTKSEDICRALFFMFDGEDYEQADWTMTTSMIIRLQPASVSQVKHLKQLAKKDGLRQFDFGTPELNVLKYGSPTPPEYNLKAGVAPVVIFYGENDYIVPPYKILKIADEYMSAGTQVRLKKIEWPKFNHFDFMYAKDIAKLLNRRIIQELNNITKLADEE